MTSVGALVEDRDGIDVRQAGCRPRFPREPIAERGIVGQPGGHHLDGHLPIEPRIDGAIHRGHPAARDARGQEVSAF